MTKKIGRNDPCPCGSGKKYKQCCLAKQGFRKPKMSAKWINRPKVPNLMERTFGETIAHTEKTYHPLSDDDTQQPEQQENES